MKKLTLIISTLSLYLNLSAQPFANNTFETINDYIHVTEYASLKQKKGELKTSIDWKSYNAIVRMSDIWVCDIDEDEKDFEVEHKKALRIAIVEKKHKEQRFIQHLSAKVIFGEECQYHNQDNLGKYRNFQTAIFKNTKNNKQLQISNYYFSNDKIILVVDWGNKKEYYKGQFIRQKSS